MDWTRYDSDACSVARTLEVLGDRWTVLVLRELFNGVHRFDEIQAHIGISRSVLTRRLADLVDAGLLQRRPYHEPGDRRRHEYALTNRGRGLRPVLVAMTDFGDTYLAEDGGPPVVLRHTGCGMPVHTELRCEDGHPISSGRELAAEPGPGARRRVGT